MADSGIEIDLMNQLGAEDDSISDQLNFYELKSTVVVGSPVTEIKHASLPMRANLKQQLQRQQLLDQERRQSFKNGAHTVTTTGSIGINVPRVVEAAVPTNVLQVKTQLQHPTKYHVRQSQKRQVQHFLSEHHNGQPIHSLPANVISVSSLEQQSQQQQHHQQYAQTSSSAPDPDIASPLLHSSAGGDLSDFGLLQDVPSIDQLELGSILGGSDLVEIQPSLGNSQYSTDGFLPGLEGLEAESPTTPGKTSSNSCPTGAYHHKDITQTGIMSVQDEMWRKERIKKDNHNMIERRRRFNINDRIKELGGLLPRGVDPDLRQNKGTILKASVDYIKTLQDDQRKYKAMMEEKRRTEMDLRKVLLKVNQMQLVMKSHGLSSPGVDDLELTSSYSNLATDFLNSSALLPTAVVTTSSVPTFSPAHLTTSPINMDELMDESSPVSGDPMLMSSPVSPETEDQTFYFGFHQ